MNITATRIDRCRICSNRSLLPAVNIGDQYLSSLFPPTLDYRGDIPKLPLDLVLCEKKDHDTCGLVQLAHQIDLSEMYAAYPYTSATNSSMSKILQNIADNGRALGHLRPGDVILDIGGNDGTLLSFFRDGGYDLVCIDAAQNIKPVFDHQRVTGYFTAKSYQSIATKPARLIFSIAMFYHLADPIAFARDVAACLDDDGVWIIQMAYLPTMLQTNMYDNIVHEHAGYYGTRHLRWMMERVGLEIFDVELNDVYGGSFRVFVKKKGCSQFKPSACLRDNLDDELRLGIYATATYEAFRRRIERTRDELRKLCGEIKAAGKKIWVYGASTKGNTILQYCNLGKEDLVAAADANPFKFGKFIVGADIPITDEPTMRAARPDYLLALPYSFVDAFMKREAVLIAQGTKFIVPLPDVRILP